MKFYFRLSAYCIAVGSTVIALLLRICLEPLLYQTLGAFFYIAVLVSSWYGGFFPGLVTVVLSALAINYFFIPPHHQFGFSQPQDVLQLIIFILLALIINWITNGFRNSKLKIQQLSQQLAQEAEQTLGKELLRIQTLFNTSFDGIVILDLHGNVIDANPRFSQMLGYTKEEIAKLNIIDWNAQFTPEQIQQIMSDYINFKTGVLETRHRRKDGSIYDVEVGISIVEWQGEILRFCVCRNITERKQAQEALRKSEQRYRALVLASSQIVWRTDAQGSTIAIPEGWEELTGQSPVECLDWGWLNFVHPEDRDRTTQSWQTSCTNSSLYEVEYRLRMKDGNYRNFISRGVPILDNHGNINEWIGTCTDITSSKQAEAALQENRIQLQQQLAEIETIYQSAPIGLNVVDTNLRFIRINERLAEMNGFTVAEHIGRTVRELLPDLADAAEAVLLPILETGKPLLNVEITGETPAQPGVQRTWLESFLPLKDGDRVIGISTVCEEITERKKAEAALTKAKEELENRVNQRTAELKQANDLLIETLKQQQQTQAALEEYVHEIEDLYNNAPCGYHSLDAEGNCIRINNTELKWLGYTRDEMLNRKFLDIFTPESQQIFHDYFPKFKQQGKLNNIELEIFCKDGSTRWMSLNATAIKDEAGNFLMSRSTLFDISERKQVEFALRESEEGRRQALNLTHTAFWDLHLPSGHLVWNDNHFTLLGLTPYSVEPSYEVWHNAIHPEDVGWVEQQFLASIESHTDYASEYRVVHPDGSVHWLMARGRATYDESGQPVRSLGVLLDITERKHTISTLHQYERIVSSTKDGIALINRNYIYQIVNQAYLDWCNKTEIEVLGHSVRDILGVNLFENFIKHRLDQCLEGETVKYEKWFDHPNIVKQFMSVTYTPYLEPDGSISGVIVSLRDITKLKQAEQNLELQAVVTRNMAEGVCLVSATNGMIVYANPKFEKMFGYDSGELNNKHVSIVNYANESVTAEDVNQAIRAAVLERKEATYEVHNVKKDGTPFWCSATCSVFNHADYGDVLVAVHQDITDKKQIADALRESEEKFRQLAENIQAVFWMTDIQSQQVLYVSPAYETIWRRSCESLYQDFSDWLDSIHPEDIQRVKIALDQQVKGEYDLKYRIIQPDDSIRWIRDRAFPIKNESGQVIRIAGVAEDITELQKIEEMKSEFISIVSHELRTPLTSIHAAMGLLETGIYDKKPEKSKRMIEIAVMESERLVRLVNDILDLERLESGRAVLEKTNCEAADLIAQAVAGMQAIAKQQNISFNVHSTNIQVWAASDTIIQTLTNLLGNAIKFSPHNSTITLSVQPQIDYAIFSISDQGRGIPADKLESIFGRFQQVDASDSRSKGGTGLGLAICRSIIEQNGGQIWVESVVDVGSTFFFTLPIGK